MSASAGKIMPRPMGEYNSATEYKILDIVTYNDRPYMALQTTAGNLPTNTTYWMLLLDFPTQVDNVPTQNSQNLVYSGGVYDATADKMKKDGSNADEIVIGSASDTQWYFGVSSITKDSGAEQDVIITKVVNHTDSKPTVYYETILKSFIGSPRVRYLANNVNIYVVIDSVATTTDTSSDTITATCHLKEDTSEAISIGSETLYLNNYSYGDYNILNGAGNAAYGDYISISGMHNVNNGSRGLVAGDSNVVKGDDACIVGTDNYGIRETFVGGYYNRAGYRGQAVLGCYNDNKSETVFEVGSGSSLSRKNAFEVYGDGHVSMNNGTDQYKFAKSGGVDGFYDGSNNFHPFTGYKELVNNSVVLSTSADTTVTFSDASITADSTIEPFTSVYSIAPTDCVASAGTCTVTIPKQSTAQTIKVKIRIS